MSVIFRSDREHIRVAALIFPERKNGNELSYFSYSSDFECQRARKYKALSEQKYELKLYQSTHRRSFYISVRG